MIEPNIKQDLEKIRSRAKLKAYQNNIVIFIANVTDFKKGAGQYILLKDITIIKPISENRGNKIYLSQDNLQIDHLWVDESIIKNKLQIIEETNSIICFGEIEKYLRADSSQAYGIIPINKDLFKLAYLKYYFCWLNQLRKDSQKYYSKRSQLEELLDKTYGLMKEIHYDDTSQGKLLRLNIDEDLMDGLVTMIVQCREDLAKYDKNKNKKEKRNHKGFGKKT